MCLFACVCVCVYSILLCWRNVCGMLNKNNEKTEGVNDWLFCWLAPQTKKYKTLSFIFKQAFTHIFLQYRDWKPAHTHSNTHRGSCVCSIIPQAFLVSLFFSKTSSFRNWEQTQWELRRNIEETVFSCQLQWCTYAVKISHFLFYPETAYCCKSTVVCALPHVCK